MHKLLKIAGVSALALASAAQATETLTYRYDARGRLVRIERTGTVNNGVVTEYKFDRAHNRTEKTTS